MTDLIESIEKLDAKLSQLRNLLRSQAPSGAAAFKVPIVVDAIKQAKEALAALSVKLGKVG